MSKPSGDDMVPLVPDWNVLEYAVNFNAIDVGPVTVLNTSKMFVQCFAFCKMYTFKGTLVNYYFILMMVEPYNHKI